MKRFLILCLIIFETIGVAKAGTILRACASDAGQPPFSFYLPDANGGNGKVSGLSVDILSQITSGMGRSLVVTMLPWRRCIQLVEIGQQDIAMDVRSMIGMQTHLLFSEPYFTLHPVVISSLLHPIGNPDLLPVFNMHVRVCALAGRSYEMYGIPISILDAEATQYGQLFAKIMAGRCDMAIEHREILGGLYVAHPELIKYMHDPSLSIRPFPDGRVETMRFAVAAGSGELLRQIDVGIVRMSKQNEVDRLLFNWLH